MAPPTVGKQVFLRVATATTTVMRGMTSEDTTGQKAADGRKKSPATPVKKQTLTVLAKGKKKIGNSLPMQPSRHVSFPYAGKQEPRQAVTDITVVDTSRCGLSESCYRQVGLIVIELIDCRMGITMKVDDNTYRILSAKHVRKQLLILFGRQVLKGFTFNDDIAALVGNHIIHLQKRGEAVAFVDRMMAVLLPCRDTCLGKGNTQRFLIDILRHTYWQLFIHILYDANDVIHILLQLSLELWV